MTWMKTNLRLAIFKPLSLKHIIPHKSVVARLLWQACEGISSSRTCRSVGNDNAEGQTAGDQTLLSLVKTVAGSWCTCLSLNYSRALNDKSNYQLLPLAAVVSTNTSILTLSDIFENAFRMQLLHLCQWYRQRYMAWARSIHRNICGHFEITAIGQKLCPLCWTTEECSLQNILATCESGVNNV